MDWLTGAFDFFLWYHVPCTIIAFALTSTLLILLALVVEKVDQ